MWQATKHNRSCKQLAQSQKQPQQPPSPPVMQPLGVQQDAKCKLTSQLCRCPPADGDLHVGQASWCMLETAHKQVFTTKAYRLLVDTWTWPVWSSLAVQHSWMVQHKLAVASGPTRTTCTVHQAHAAAVWVSPQAVHYPAPTEPPLSTSPFDLQPHRWYAKELGPSPHPILPAHG